MLDARGPGIRQNFELVSAIQLANKCPVKLHPIVSQKLIQNFDEYRDLWHPASRQEFFRQNFQNISNILQLIGGILTSFSCGLIAKVSGLNIS